MGTSPPFPSQSRGCPRSCRVFCDRAGILTSYPHRNSHLFPLPRPPLRLNFHHAGAQLKLLSFESGSSNVSPKKPLRKKRPPLLASVLSSLTFCSGRNGGPAPRGSKTTHPGAQRSSGSGPKSKAIKTLPLSRFHSILCQKNPAKFLIPIDRVGRGYPQLPTSTHPRKPESPKKPFPASPPSKNLFSGE